MLTDLLFSVANSGNSQVLGILQTELNNLLNFSANIFTKQYLGGKSWDFLRCPEYTYN